MVSWSLVRIITFSNCAFPPKCGHFCQFFRHLPQYLEQCQAMVALCPIKGTEERHWYISPLLALLARLMHSEQNNCLHTLHLQVPSSTVVTIEALKLWSSAYNGNELISAAGPGGARPLCGDVTLSRQSLVTWSPRSAVTRDTRWCHVTQRCNTPLIVCQQYLQGARSSLDM